MYDQSQGGNYLNCSKGFWSWFGTLDHKRLGLMYMWSVMGAMLVGGLFAMMMRLELFAPGEQFVNAEVFNHLFTLHGAIMVFLALCHRHLPLYNLFCSLVLRYLYLVQHVLLHSFIFH